ncbi:MAG: hypothetical protein O3A14_15925 [Cyanobacteria bacterium]|nr:hypothetical protein [Cyanobacteriota bacterium]
MPDTPQFRVPPEQLERLAAAAYDNYPSPELRATAQTRDQQDWFEEIHSWHQAIRACWVIRIATSPRERDSPSAPPPPYQCTSQFDPLLPYLDTKQIDPLHHKLVWSQVDEADSWFSLIATCLSELNTALGSKSPSPSTAYHWFVSLRQAAVNNQYRVCLENYVEIPKTAVKQSADFLRHLEHHDEKALQRHERRAQHRHPLDHLTTPELGFILTIAKAKAQRDPETRQHLAAYQQAKAQQADIMATMLARTRDSATLERPRAMAWYKGQKKYGQPQGGTYG